MKMEGMEMPDQAATRPLMPERAVRGRIDIKGFRGSLTVITLYIEKIRSLLIAGETDQSMEIAEIVKNQCENLIKRIDAMEIAGSDDGQVSDVMMRIKNDAPDILKGISASISEAIELKGMPEDVLKIIDDHILQLYDLGEEMRKTEEYAHDRRSHRPAVSISDLRKVVDDMKKQQGR